jgi:hypothetical protein
MVNLVRERQTKKVADTYRHQAAHGKNKRQEETVASEVPVLISFLKLL